MIKPQTLKGFRDFLPQEARKRNYVIDKLTSVFKRYGFEPLETPTLEYEEILAGKYGEEGDKLMYRFEDNGKRRVAMRYDQTVPLSRVVAQYQNDLSMPFKRYQIQNVWRADKPQRGRYREFLQCDIDIVGNNSALADAEIVGLIATAYRELGFTKFKILLNDRAVFSALANGKEYALREQELPTVIRILDKLKKIGKENVLKELISSGIAADKADYILESIACQEPTERLKEIFTYLETFNITPDQCEFLPTLARGLDYYTGLIIEVEIDGYTVGSAGGGGRYDNLIGMFVGRQMPAVGFAFGFDRIIEAMDQLTLFPTDLANATTKVLVTLFSQEFKQKSLEVASQLRSQNINTELYLGEIKEKNPFEKQLKYADQKKIPYVLIIGPEEVEKNVVTIKDMQSRTQEKTTFEDFAKRIRNNE